MGTDREREVAPAGERLGLAGWVRKLGWQLTGDRRTPPRVWTRENMHMVSDESDLTSYLAGPRATSGATCAVQVGSFLAVRVIAGEAGCKFFMDLQTGTAPSQGFVWRTFPNIAAAEATAPATAATAPASPYVPLYQQQPEPLSSRVFIGRTVANFAATGVMPTYFIRDVAAAAAGAFHIGGTEYRPRFWLAPGVVFHLAAIGAAGAWYITVNLEEPGSPPG
ncbi:MAG TPA: hypothetical protein VJP77_09900 [Planctomycetota bacterium]|nr:hypothetical protein [Planctomycetota bacterium]